MSAEQVRVAPFQRIADALRLEILEGRLAPGSRLPSENQLAEQYKTTRVTVRKSIAQLRAEGLVVTSQGSRSFVRSRPHVRLLLTGTNYRERRKTGVSNFTAEALAQGQQATQQLLEVTEVPAPPEIASRLQLDDEAVVVARRRLFTIDHEPVQLCDGYYPRELVAGTEIADLRRIKGGVHAVIEAPDGPIRRRIVQFVEDLDIRMPIPGETETLRIPPGVPVARVLRTAYDAAGQPIEVLDSLVPCDRHVFRYVIDVP